MLNKKVLLGTLVAGALILPQVASAGIVSGLCVDCHTMHNTDGNGTDLTTGPNSQLTRGNSCEGCHAKNLGNTGTTGKRYDAESYAAPQVDDAANPNLAGFFNRDNSLDGDARQHNPYNSIAGIDADGALTGPPGTDGGSMNTCQGCHETAAGGHHGTTAANNYRMLTAPIAGFTVDDNYGGRASQNNGGYDITPDTSNTTYDADVMNDVCASCHGVFHGSTQKNASGAWIRHPTDLVLTNSATQGRYDYLANYGAANADDLVPLGTSSSDWDNTAGETPNTLMCITCHYSHGGAYPDLLRFDYATQVAGGTDQSPGCESCHSYGTDGM